MPTVREIELFLEKLAPPELKLDFDNVGLLLGKPEAQVSRALVALDITEAVIDEAAAIGASLIVSHHPLFFDIKQITNAEPTGRKIIRLAESGISAICMHTNLDAAKGGVNDALAGAVGLTETHLLHEEGTQKDGTPYGIGRIGTLPEARPLPDYLRFVKTALQAEGLRYHDAGRPVQKVAVLGGSGGDYLPHALETGCDTFLTADVKYHVFLTAREENINLIDGGHFSTENVICPILAEKLKKSFPDIQITLSQRHTPTARFF